MAKTGQDLLDVMEVLHPELQNQTGEADVTKSLLALNLAQDYMESILAQQPDLLGDASSILSTASLVEKTLFPQGVLRLDKLQMLDSATNRPSYDLDDIRRTGGHVAAALQPAITNVLSGTSGAQPAAYYTDGSYVYWYPLPDAAYTIRWYGFQSKGDLAAGTAFAYPDITVLPVCTFACRIIRMGLDDDVSAYLKMAQDTFEPVVNLMGNFQRERAPGMQYRYHHWT